MNRPLCFVPLAIGALLLATSAAAAGVAPLIFQTDGQILADARARYQTGDAATVKVVEKLVREGDKALDFQPVSVIDKPYTPPSGDKHDYMSLSPYWWPNPDTSDAKPYIRKDGQINPDREKYDLQPMEDMAKAVEQLALAYYFTEDEKYAEHAAKLIRVWFLDPGTRMNPNVKYAQFVPGVEEEDRAAGVIETNRIRKVVDADGLLRGSKAWTSDDSARLKAWFSDYLNYLLSSEQGIKEANAPNNHGTWYGVQTATYALYTGNEQLAKKLIREHGFERIARQIEPDGSQPEELARTTAFDYSRYNILAFVELAMLGERVGLDLWNHQTDDGRSLRRAIDWLLPYALDEKPWQYQQIKPRKMKEMATVLRRAANAYNEPKYEQAIIRLPDLENHRPTMMTDLFFPPRVGAEKQAAGR